MALVSDRYRLPLLQAGQAQKEVTHNEALAALDLLIHLAAQSRSVTAPPSSPGEGQCWVVPIGATGGWAGDAGRIAAFSAGGWQMIDPRAGCLAWIVDEAMFVYHDGAGWRADGWPAAGLRIAGRQLIAATASAIAGPSGGTTVDAESRAAINGILAALRTLGLVAI